MGVLAERQPIADIVVLRTPKRSDVCGINDSASFHGDDAIATQRAGVVVSGDDIQSKSGAAAIGTTAYATPPPLGFTSRSSDSHFSNGILLEHLIQEEVQSETNDF